MAKLKDKMTCSVNTVKNNSGRYNKILTIYLADKTDLRKYHLGDVFFENIPHLKNSFGKFIYYKPYYVVADDIAKYFSLSEDDLVEFAIECMTEMDYKIEKNKE